MATKSKTNEKSGDKKKTKRKDGKKEEQTPKAAATPKRKKPKKTHVTPKPKPNINPKAAKIGSHAKKALVEKRRDPEKHELLSRCAKYIVQAELSELQVVSLENYRVLSSLDFTPDRVVAVHQSRSDEALIVVTKSRERARADFATFSLPGLKPIAPRAPLPGDKDRPTGKHVRVATNESTGELVHFSVRGDVLFRSDRQKGERSFHDVHGGLYSFGRDYVCTVAEEGMKKKGLRVKIYLDNNPRYCLERSLKSVCRHGGVTAVEALWDRPHVALGTAEGQILLVQVGGAQNNLVKTKVHWHSMPVRALCWNGDGRYLYSGGGEAVLVKWSVTEAAKVAMAPRLGDAVETVHEHDAAVVARLRDGTTHCLSGQLVVRNTGVVQVSKRVASASHVYWHPPTKSIAITTRTDYVDFYSPATRKTVLSLEVNDRNVVRGRHEKVDEAVKPPRFALSPSGNTMVTVHDRTAIRVWELSVSGDRFELASLIVEAHEEDIGQLEAVADGVVVSSSGGGDAGDKTVRIWRKQAEVEEDKAWFLQNSVSYKGYEPTAFAVSSDLSALAVAYHATVTVWHLEDNALKAVLFTQDKKTREQPQIEYMAFGQSDDCRHMLFCADDKGVSAWNLITSVLAWRTEVANPVFKAIDGDLHVLSRSGVVYKVAKYGSELTKIMEKKQVKNLIKDDRGNYHYITSRNELKHSTSVEHDPDETAMPPPQKQKDFFASTRIGKSASPTSQWLAGWSTQPSFEESLIQKPVARNTDSLLEEAL